jgi:hypothetical protein
MDISLKEAAYRSATSEQTASAIYKKLRELVNRPEIYEFCMGYSDFFGDDAKFLEFDKPIYGGGTFHRYKCLGAMSHCANQVFIETVQEPRKAAGDNEVLYQTRSTIQDNPRFTKEFIRMFLPVGASKDAVLESHPEFMAYTFHKGIVASNHFDETMSMLENVTKSKKASMLGFSAKNENEYTLEIWLRASLIWGITYHNLEKWYHNEIVTLTPDQSPDKYVSFLLNFMYERNYTLFDIKQKLYSNFSQAIFNQKNIFNPVTRQSAYEVLKEALVILLEKNPLGKGD